MSEAGKMMTKAQQDAAIEAIRNAMPFEKQKANMLAEARRIHYDASIRKGFTKDEALILCMNMNF